MEQSHSWEAGSSSDYQEIPCFLWNLKNDSDPWSELVRRFITMYKRAHCKF